MAGSGYYKICLQSAGVAGLTTLDVDPARSQYTSALPTDHDQDGSPIFQGYDSVVWEFDEVTDTLVDLLRPLEGEDVIIKTRLADKYSWGNRNAVFEKFVTDPVGSRRWIKGVAYFIKVESL